MAPDLLYIVRPGDDNEELKYSLRSVAANLPHGRIFIAGHTPAWVTGVVSVPTDQTERLFTLRQKFARCRGNLLAGISHQEIGEDVLLFNDDFFITERISEVPVLHYGTLSDFMGYFRRESKITSSYMLAEQYTHQWLQQYHGIGVPLSYSLHVPLPVKRDLFREILTALPGAIPGTSLPPHVRTVYGNLAGLGGRKSPDVKVLRRTLSRPLSKPFSSTSDRTFVMGAGSVLRSMFNTPCQYEA